MSESIRVAIIGGSGIYNLDGIEIVKEHSVETPFGKTSDLIFEAKYEGIFFYFLPRHGRDHEFLPSEVNYRANIFALKKLGARYVISVSAVGSLKEECAPTDFVLVDQFIDWTKGRRERSFFGNGMAGHVSTANPISIKLQNLIAKSCEATGVTFHKKGSYVCIEGPQFSTKAESNIYRSFGATVIGMTNVPEAYLAKEAAIEYATIAMVTDYDCWKDEHCSVEEIMKTMKENNKNVQVLLKHLLPFLNENLFSFEKENTCAVMTNASTLSKDNQNILKVLQS
jgi:5'-methylthioadenosine phosphorylase